MSIPLRVLMVEDSVDDAELILQELRRGGYDPDWHRVDSPADLSRALREREWEVITCDYNIPGLRAATALELMQEHRVGAPVIVVSDETGADAAVVALKRGARDVVSKYALSHLVPTIARELRDAGERRARLAAEDTYRTLVEHSLQGLTIYQDGRFVFANPAAATILGYSVEQLTQLTPEQVIGLLHPDERELGRARIAGRLAGEPVPPRSEFRVIRGDGAERVLDMSTTRIEFRGRPALQTMCVDVTERHEAQAALRRTQERLRTYIDEASDALYTLDLSGRVSTANQAACAITGYAHAELIGKNALELVVPEARADAAATLGRLLSGGTFDHYDVQILSKDGRRVWLEIRGRHIYEGDRLVEVFHIARDVTARRQADDERARLSAAVEQAVESIMITNLDGRIVYVNGACERMTGYVRAELLGRDPALLRSSRSEAEMYRRMLSALAGERIWHWAEVQRRKDGRLYEVDVVVFPVYDAEGRLINYVGLGRDVTQQRQVEAQLRQAHKLEAIERLAGGMAHDFNNQLTVIKGCVQLLLAQLPPDDGRRTDAEQINATVDKSARLVRQLLTFSRPQPIDTRHEDLVEVVHDMGPMLRVLLGEQIQLRLELPTDLWPVRCDRERIERVVTNLVGNAREALAASGAPVPGARVSIAIHNVHLDEDTRGLVGDVPPGPYVMLTVSDNGPGMGPDVQEHIFEPFFTTKEMGRGAGMGLATVLGIVKQHGAYIACVSTPREGSSFRIYFSPAAPPQGESAPAVEARREPGRQYAVLVAEDEDTLRELFVRALTEAGYIVHSVPNGSDALAVAARAGTSLDLFISDVVMPGQSGPAIARRLQRDHPGLRVLLISGYLSDTVDLAALNGARFLQKPFSLAELLAAVRTLLPVASP